MVLNAAKVVAAHDSGELASVIRSCSLVNADGMSVVWASRLMGRPVPERVAGIDLFEVLLGEAERKGWSVFLLGAREPVVRAVVEEVATRHPAMAIAGWRDGYWEPESEPDVVRTIRSSGADLVFVALPSPAKEYFLHRNLENLGDVVGIGVGGSFDVLAGVTKRAPAWLCRAGLEWLYRLLQEPRRMARRYIVGNTRFVLLVGRCWWTRRYP